jgi:hypothetical protein
MFKVILVFIYCLFSLSLQAAPIKFGIFDISFYGVENLVAHRLDQNYVITNHDLYSPHGAAVASLIADPQYGGTSQGLLALMNTGIDDEAFERGLSLAQALGVRVINISMHLRSKSIVDLLNQHHKNFGTIFIVSAGNSAMRMGRDLPDYYNHFEGLVVSCIDLDGTLPDFAQLNDRVDFLLPCGRSNILTRIDDLHLGLREHLFGMTSAAAPQLTSLVVDELTRSHNQITLQELKNKLREQSFRSYQFGTLKVPVLDPLDRLQD